MQYNPPQFKLLRREHGRPPPAQQAVHAAPAPVGIRELNSNDQAMLDTQAVSRRVYVGRLGGACTTESFLKDHIFKDFAVETTSVPTHVFLPLAFAFVTLATKAEADLTVARLNGKFFLGQRIIVSKARGKSLSPGNHLPAGEHHSHSGVHVGASPRIVPYLQPNTFFSMPANVPQASSVQQAHLAPARMYTPLGPDSDRRSHHGSGKSAVRYEASEKSKGASKVPGSSNKLQEAGKQWADRVETNTNRQKQGAEELKRGENNVVNTTSAKAPSTGPSSSQSKNTRHNTSRNGR